MSYDLFFSGGKQGKKKTLREGTQKVRVEIGFHSGAPLRTKRDTFPVNLKNQSSFAKLRSGTASRWFTAKKNFFRCVRWTLDQERDNHLVN